MTKDWLAVERERREKAEALIDALYCALTDYFEEYEGVYDMSGSDRDGNPYQSDRAKAAEEKARAALNKVRTQEIGLSAALETKEASK